MNSANNDDNNIYKLGYCETCEIVRPPRSFHCDQCNCCIELHDHHCPWVGTCIGRRNIRYFSLFLNFTTLYALLIFFLTMKASNLSFYRQDIDSLSDFIGLFLMVYTCIFGVSLGGFALYQMRLALLNITSNENLRSKWNATMDRKGRVLPS